MGFVRNVCFLSGEVLYNGVNNFSIFTLNLISQFNELSSLIAGNEIKQEMFSLLELTNKSDLFL